MLTSGACRPIGGPVRLWVRLGLGLAGLLLPCLLLELVLQVAGPALPGEYQTASFFETEPLTGRRNHPGEGWKQTFEYTTRVEVNSQGLRGGEIDYAKPPGEIRVLALGDSFTFAEQVDQEDTYVQRLEDRLNESGGPTRFRVLNAGMDGWGTVNELLYLANEGLKYQPDVVILGFFPGNDMSDNYRFVGSVEDAKQPDLALRGADPFAGPRQLLRRARVYGLLESGVLAKLATPAAARKTDASVRPPPRTAEEPREAWTITGILLRRLREIVESRGAKLVVMVIPSADQLSPGPRARRETDDQYELDPAAATVPGFENPQATPAEIGDRKQLAILDLLPSFRRHAAQRRTPLYYRLNAHWTSAGHALAAQELYDFLTRTALIPGVSACQC